MSNQLTSKNHAKPFQKIKMLLSTFLAVDIPDENSGLDSYINNVNINSEEDRENAEIAQALKNSLEFIDSRFI